MIGWLGGWLVYASNRPRTGNNAGGTLLIIVCVLVGVVAAIAQLIGWLWLLL